MVIIGNEAIMPVPLQTSAYRFLLSDLERWIKVKKILLIHLALSASVISATLVVAQTSTASKPKVSAKSSAKPGATKQTDAGQRKFDANCGRCHSFPEQLSPSITGTVVRHMRGAGKS
jgi:mono/diheme cytochrome c family protein